jgi:type III secretory pathway component EscS
MKKLKANWYVALTYYIYANLLGFIPLVIVSVLVNMLAKNVWSYAIASILAMNLIYYFALKISSKNINKYYLVPKISEIVTWTLYYFIIGNGLFIFINIKRQGYFSISDLVMIVSIVVGTMIIDKFSKKFLIESSPEEINSVVAMESNKKLAPEVISNKISIKAILIASLVDVIGSSVVGMLVGIVVGMYYGLTKLPPSEMSTQLKIVMTNPGIHGTLIFMGCLISIFAGYIAARIAKHRELLHGAASSFLCVIIGLFTIITTPYNASSFMLNLLLLISGPVLGLLGGFIFLKLKK